MSGRIRHIYRQHSDFSPAASHAVLLVASRITRSSRKKDPFPAKMLAAADCSCRSLVFVLLLLSQSVSAAVLRPNETHDVVLAHDVVVSDLETGTLPSHDEADELPKRPPPSVVARMFPSSLLHGKHQNNASAECGKGMERNHGPSSSPANSMTMSGENDAPGRTLFESGEREGGLPGLHPTELTICISSLEPPTDEQDHALASPTVSVVSTRGCMICLEDEPTDPRCCPKCKKCVGCKGCWEDMARRTPIVPALCLEVATPEERTERMKGVGSPSCVSVVKNCQVLCECSQEQGNLCGCWL